ncbi:acetyl-CoA carboxylase biotin carboxyl carrier protein [Catalinimonas alkaloidigena]|uniref:acetyl-CoA carboxylase biotin carboxyl carrier protein n=1 Tax=Catalinimonas alkaloidigena TaxID=1075417 RepID=UPI002405441E|nr:acetyl-CoA carboxylase biotin carboxyl carrier protein [Catalinimonas alkaloidigena]MDF9800308.1 acetyl-CoA carboxylase biotin carboxyl carrier protein [Catalinimonas alkaloidigena]
MKASEIQDLLDFISKSGLDEVNIETGEIKLKVKKNAAAKIRQNIIAAPGSSMPHDSTGLVSPSPAYYQAEQGETEAKPAAKSAGADGSSDDSKYLTVKSPMIGTFYRAANPDSDPFVQVGDRVSVGQAVCIVEAMKLFNEIESEVSGTIVKVLAEDASPVEYDQPLFLIDPS